MGRRSKTGGVMAKGDRIQFDFTYPRRREERYRPTLDVPPAGHQGTHPAIAGPTRSATRQSHGI